MRVKSVARSTQEEKQKEDQKNPFELKKKTSKKKEQKKKPHCAFKLISRPARRVVAPALWTQKSPPR